MSILVETPGYESFEKKIYSQYVYMRELLEYSSQHGDEMRQICRQADEDVASQIQTKAESGQLNNCVEGVYESYGKFDIHAYQNIPPEIIPGTSVRQRRIENEPPELIHNEELVTKPVGTKEAVVPRGYLKIIEEPK